MKQDEAELRLLDDLPVGAEGDSFQHSLYADMLAAVFRSGKPGRCVGFFGKWGQGKSSVVRQMEEKLAGQTTVITFNAWKSSGASIRRQLLLYVIRTIDVDKYKQLKEFVGVDVLRKLLLSEKDEETQVRAERRTAVRKTLSDFCLWVRVSPLLAIALLLLLLGSALVGVAIANGSQTILSIALVVLFPAGGSLALYVRKSVHLRYLGHLTIGEALSESQRIRYPEQFEELFITHVSKYCRSHGDLIVVIDDLDRCDASTVAEALAAIRQFTPDELHKAGKEAEKHFRCQFLVPCDEQQVVLALETAGHDAGRHGARTHDYESKELLRKFFDVTIRMYEMHQDDLLDYAAGLAESIDLDPQEGRDIVALVRPEDPRLVKQLLNALVLSHERIRRAHECVALPNPDELPSLENTERLLVVLRETTPRIYRKLEANPVFLSTDSWLDAIQEEDKVLVDEVARTRRFLRAAGRVSAETAEILIHGKLPRTLHDIPSAGGRLIRSVRQYDQQLFDEVLSDLLETEATSAYTWLRHEAKRIRESTAIDLRQLLTLFLCSQQASREANNISSCVEIALQSDSHLAEALADHPDLSKIEVVLRKLSPHITSKVFTVILNNFIASEGESDAELSFLLSVCNKLGDLEAVRFRTWIEQGTADVRESRKFVTRVTEFMPPDATICYGFAPAAAAAVAVHLRDWESQDSQDAPTPEACTNFILALAGDGENACRCIERILPITDLSVDPSAKEKQDVRIAAAWSMVSEFLDRVSDKCVESAYDKVEQLHDQGRFPASSVHEALKHFGHNVFRISEEQQSHLAQQLVSRFSRQDPHSGELLDDLGSPPGNEMERSGWHKITAEAGASYVSSLSRTQALAPREEAILRRMHNLRWPVDESAEQLLVRKLQAADTNINKWLDVLQPLLGNRKRRVKEKVLDCLAKGHNTGAAMTVGLKVMWHLRVDKDSAEGLAEYFTSAIAPLAQMMNNWNAIREKPGIGNVVELMQSILVKRKPDLRRDECGLRVVAGEFDHLDTASKRSFLNSTVWELLHSPNISIRQRGYEVAKLASQTSRELQNELQDSRYRRQYHVPQGHEPHIEAILNKPLI